MNIMQLLFACIILAGVILSVNVALAYTGTDGKALDGGLLTQHSEREGSGWSCSRGAESGREFYRGRRGELAFIGGNGERCSNLH